MRSILRSVLLLVSTLAACNASVDDNADSDESAASVKAGEPGIKVSAEGRLTLDKDALGSRVFDLVTTAIYAEWDSGCLGEPPATAEPPGDLFDTCFYNVVPLIPRLVTFSRSEADIVMIDATDGELGRFPIREESKNKIAFDFSPAVVHVKMNLAKDAAATGAVPVKTKALMGRRVGDFAVVRQEGEIFSPTKEEFAPGRLKHGLRAHHENSKFRPARQGADKVFYEINSPDRPIAKIDFSDGKVYKIASVGIPAQWQAVADASFGAALDYWNRVFRAASGEKARVFFARDTESRNAFSHDPGANVLQWMTFEGNASSSGNFQTHPTTGEIFVTNAKISAGFFPTGKKMGAKFFEYLNGAPAPEPTAMQFMADYMVETIAHEIGHTLGLNHNFEASNIDQGYTPADLPQLARDYFAKRRGAPQITTTTMEYLPIPLAGIVGSRMRTEILPQDLRAIALAYYGRDIDLEPFFGEDIARKTKALAYCNDQNMPKDAAGESCRMFDHPLCPFDGPAEGAFCFTKDKL